jgi:hypothetical protein
MSKLNDLINHSKFPSKRTGISYQQNTLSYYQRKKDNKTYQCSLCDCDIKPDDYLHAFIGNTTIPIEKFDPFTKKTVIENHDEVAGFICGKCDKEISYNDRLYYG